MACRSLERGRAAADDIIRETGIDVARLPVMQLDVSSLCSVRSFANTFKTSTPLIHSFSVTYKLKCLQCIDAVG